jgi:hypothetical protein
MPNVVSASITWDYVSVRPVALPDTSPKNKAQRGRANAGEGEGGKETYSGVKVTPVTSSASTILTSGTTDSGRTFGLSGGGVGGVDDLDLVISLAMFIVARWDRMRRRGVIEGEEARGAEEGYSLPVWMMAQGREASGYYKPWIDSGGALGFSLGGTS